MTWNFRVSFCCFVHSFVYEGKIGFLPLLSSILRILKRVDYNTLWRSNLKINGISAISFSLCFIVFIHGKFLSLFSRPHSLTLDWIPSWSRKRELEIVDIYDRKRKVASYAVLDFSVKCSRKGSFQVLVHWAARKTESFCLVWKSRESAMADFEFRSWTSGSKFSKCTSPSFVTLTALLRVGELGQNCRLAKASERYKCFQMT